MTQTQRKPRTQKIQLASTQVYIKRPGCPDPLQTLIEGCPDWSYAESKYRPAEVNLYYKGRYTMTLTRKDDAFEVCTHAHSRQPVVRYDTLADVVQNYITEHPRYLEVLDGMNKSAGLEEWCLHQSFTTAKLALRITLPRSERQRIEQTARAAFYSGGLEDLVMDAVYAYLPELERRYSDRLNKDGEEHACK